MPFATPHDTENTASGPNSHVVAPAGATFFDDFSKGSLDTSKWIASNWGAPGGGKFVPSYLDFSSGMLRIKVTQTYTSTGGISSVGGELQSKNTLGFGTYEWVMRASSTSSTPTGSGVCSLRPDQFGLRICEQLTDRDRHPGD